MNEPVVLPDETSTPDPDARKVSRRRFLKRGLIGTSVLGFSSLGYAWRVEPHWIEVTHHEMAIKNLPAELEGKRLVQISDLHVGEVVDDDYVIHALKTVNDLQPDILALTGDLASFRSAKQFDQSAHVLSFLEKPKLAAVAILGNHEYGFSCTSQVVANRFHTVLETAGFVVLRNTATTVQGMQIIGVDDFWGPNCNLEKSLSMFDSEKATLVLCHNPDALDRDEWNGYDGWVLSGHTHGGQCRVPGLTPPILPVKNKLYTSGKIPIADGRTLYINRGLGYLRRLRFCARPEITVFTLTKK
jgi:uncharacterized protein